MYRSRSRTINIRLTDTELERLKTASQIQGARCLSDFARSVLFTTAGEPAAVSPEPGEPRIQAFEKRLSAVESSLARIAGALADAMPVGRF